MKIIIVGCGRTGSYVAKEFCKVGYEVSVIDRNPLAFEKLGDDFAGDTITGTGIDEEILIRAGIRRTDALIAVTKGDNTNAMIGQIGRYLYKVPQVMVRISDPQSMQFYENKIGLSCYCPTLSGADSLIRALGEVR